MAHWAAAVLCLALGACASLSRPASGLPDVPVPAAWSAAGPSAAGRATGAEASPRGDVDSRTPARTATSLVDWWQRFDDPLLSSLVNQALQANTEVRSAEAALRQSRALRDVAAAGQLPSIGSSASGQRSRSGDNPAGNLFKAGFDASWEPDVFGAQRATLDASDADAQASAARLGDVQVSIAAEVAVTYLQTRGAQARLAIARENLSLQQQTLQIAEWRVQAGLATSLDSEQARAALEQTRAQIPSLETSLAQSRHSLAVLTGQPPAALQAQLETPGPVPQPADDLALNIPAETLRQRADVRAAEHRVTAAAERVFVADAARYPSFRLSGSVGLSALTLGSLTGGGALARAVLGSVSWPVFDGGAASAQVRSQQAALEQARLAWQAAVLTALKDVEDALVALAGNRERLQRLRSAAEAAANASLLAQQRYSSGLIDFQTVLETQRTLLSAQDSVASTSAELSADHVRLYKALGGGWRSDASDRSGDGGTVGDGSSGGPGTDTPTPAQARTAATATAAATAAAPAPATPAAAAHRSGKE